MRTISQFLKTIHRSVGKFFFIMICLNQDINIWDYDQLIKVLVMSKLLYTRFVYATTHSSMTNELIAINIIILFIKIVHWNRKIKVENSSESNDQHAETVTKSLQG